MSNTEHSNPGTRRVLKYGIVTLLLIGLLLIVVVGLWAATTLTAVVTPTATRTAIALATSSPRAVPTVAATKSPPLSGTPQPTTTSTPQVTPTRTPRLTRTPRPTVQIFALNQLADLKGQRVTVEGQITGSEIYAAGIKFTLSDSTGTGVLLLRDSVYADVPDRDKLGVGVRVRAVGVVREHGRGVVVALPQGRSVQVIGGQLAPTPTPPVAMPINLIDASMNGQVVTIDAYIVRVQAAAKQRQYIMDDASGKRITLLLYLKVYDAVLNKDQLVKGARVRATGIVEEFKAERFRVVPQVGMAVSVIP